MLCCLGKVALATRATRFFSLAVRVSVLSYAADTPRLHRKGSRLSSILLSWVTAFMALRAYLRSCYAGIHDETLPYLELLVGLQFIVEGIVGDEGCMAGMRPAMPQNEEDNVSVSRSAAEIPLMTTCGTRYIPQH